MTLTDEAIRMSGSEGSQSLWPLQVPLSTTDGQPNGSISISPGITILVGPNGSGKTRALRAIKASLNELSNTTGSHRKVRFLAAGRSSPFEHFRSSSDAPNHHSQTDAAVGHASYVDSWWNIESITGDLLTLSNRADLKLKVEARLQQLFDRSVDFTWSQDGLKPRITSLRDGTAYSANHEASGILQLFALLAAIHNDEIGYLIIDEPEISLHPQHQAFVLQEIERVAGDPIDPHKKIVVIATHAPTLLPLKSTNDLPRFAFFNDVRSAPAQIAPLEPVLQNTKLRALLARLSATHRMAIFAERVLLVEGPSDETIVTQLSNRMDWPLMARNAEVLPVTGKSEFVEVAKLFRLMNKEVGVLADLDALSDDNALVNFFSSLPKAKAAAEQMGFSSAADLDGALRNDLGKFLVTHAETISHLAQTYPDWSTDSPIDLRRKRVTLARLLTKPESFEGPAAASAASLSSRFGALLSILGEAGCFFLRRGAIESYYKPSQQPQPKPAAAAVEAASFELSERADLEARYADGVAAIRFIAPARGVEENRILRPKLGAAISAVFQSMSQTSSRDELNAMAKATIGSSAEIFDFENVSKGEQRRIRVSIASSLFLRDNFPIEVAFGQNINDILPQVLPTAVN